MFGLGSPCVTNSSNLEDYSGTICMSCSCIPSKVPVTLHHRTGVLFFYYLSHTAELYPTEQPFPYDSLHHFNTRNITTVTLLQQRSHEEPLEKTPTAKSTCVPRLYLPM